MQQDSYELAELLPETSTLPRQGIGINMRRLIKLRGKLMLLVAVVIGVPAVAAIALLMPEEYVASAQIEFRAIAPQIRSDEGVVLTGNTYEQFVNTQIDLIDGYTILQRVAKDPAVQGLAVGQSENVIAELMDGVECEYEQDNQLVTVTYRDYEAGSAATVINAILDAYRTYIEEDAAQEGDIRNSTLARKEKEMNLDLERMRQEIAERRKELNLPSGGDTPANSEPLETEALRINLAQAQTDLTQTQTDVRSRQSMIDRIKRLIAQYESNPGRQVFEFNVERDLLLNPHVALLAEQLAAMQQQSAVLEEQYVETRPEVATARENLAALNNSMNRMKQDARGEQLRTVLQEQQFQLDLANENLLDAQQRIEQFTALLLEYRQENVDISQGLADVQEMQNRHDDVRAELADIRTALLNLDIESNAPARANILGKAEPPSEPDRTRKMQFLIVAAMGALAAGVGAGVLKEVSDHAIRSAEDITALTNLPILATIPHTSEDRFPSEVRAATLADDYPGSMTADQFRQIVGRILNRKRPVKSCMIASPVRGDGKTTLSCNLAIVLAQADRRVLLIDVDSRNPSIEASFGLRAGPGLSEMLGGEQLTHDPDRATDYENLFVLGPGLQSDDLVERIASPEMNDFLSGAEELFDHIIIDTPATLLTSEVRLLMAQVDGVLLVAGAGITSSGMLRRALEQLEAGGANVLGVVLNAVRHTPGGYLRRNMKLYYSHNPAQPHRKNSGNAPRRRSEPSIVLVNDDSASG